MARARFLDPLIVTYLGVGANGRVMYRLDREMRFRLPNGYGSITVPGGFVTDFASVPRWLWWICPPSGDYTPAAVVHDFIYARRQRAFSRWFADAVFRLAMEACGVPLWRRWAMWAAVRLYSWRYWRD